MTFENSYNIEILQGDTNSDVSDFKFSQILAPNIVPVKCSNETQSDCEQEHISRLSSHNEEVDLSITNDKAIVISFGNNLVKEINIKKLIDSMQSQEELKLCFDDHDMVPEDVLQLKKMFPNRIITT